MNVEIDSRQNQLKYLQNYLNEVDTEVTMILQNLQWDRKYLAEHKPMVSCQYDTSHRVPPDKLLEHEKKCFLKSQDYTEDCLLPSPVDPDAATLIKLSGDNVAEIITIASVEQPLFRTGAGCSGPQPSTIERLQATYTADERRAIHDAVVNRVPTCHDLSDLALPSSKDDVGKESKVKSKLEILAELRDMRRRRTKYRVAAKTRNYSDVLRDVIVTQMDYFYSQSHNSGNQMHVKSNNLDSDNTAKDDVSKEKNTTGHSANTTNKKCHGNEHQTLVSSNDVYDMARHSKHPEEYEIRKRRHNDSDDIHSSTKYSKTREHEKLTSSKTDHRYKDNIYDSKSKRRDEGNTDSEKSNRERYKYHDHHATNYRHREKEYDCRGNPRAQEYTSNATKDKTSDSRNDYSKLKDKHYSYDRYYSHRERQEHDHHRSKKSNPKSTDNVDRKTRFEYRQKKDQRVRIKKEKDDYYNDDSSSNETDRSDLTETQYYDVTKVKVEKEVYVKKERDNVRDYREAKSSDTFNERQKSKRNCGRQGTWTKYKDKYEHYETRKEKANYKDNQPQERGEAAIQKIKKEKDIM